MFKRYFITGLLIWVPLAITAWVLSMIIRAMDQSLLLLPEAIHPINLLGFNIPGAGAVLTLATILITGLLAANFIGQKLVGWWERILARIPVVNSLYNAVKQVSDTILSPNGNAFRKALLVQYPRQGSWTIAFLTGQPGGDVANHLDGKYVSVYVPTTPNPTSGFFLMMPAEDVVELKMSVDEALKYIVSMGVVPPSPKSRRRGKTESPQSISSGTP
ncbi:DUF502 domain-containing protein [Azovibrio restrictus]|uniref:DUF502 domain-containing protein n=1 Tax=Azovibrio restrictus TaxID=146938 RepID=UPI0026F09CD5|nr:DUF502 domain-containing protein [Azovibrio restrictus]MDD3483231.1 DUF502 domain-containing protein [Azovibrio restrictus]